MSLQRAISTALLYISSIILVYSLVLSVISYAIDRYYARKVELLLLMKRMKGEYNERPTETNED